MKMKRYEKIARNTVLGVSIAIPVGVICAILAVGKIAMEVGIF